jgi:2-phosphoglycerate kinase
MKKVIVIGGTPYSGKTTLARRLSAKLGYSCISTDDLGSAIRAVLPDDPELNPNGGRSYEEYYLSEPGEKLISDTELYHNRLKPAVLRVIEGHLHYSGPAVIEGWSLYPGWFSEPDANLGILWLVCEPETILNRILNDTAFLNGHPKRTEIIEKYSARCVWQNSKIEKEALHASQNLIRVNGSITQEGLLETVLNAIND